MDGCGYSFWRPKWMQKFSKTRWFICVYALMGTFQAASGTYFVITLTTIEKRFRIPSETTGIILTGNEISQMLFSLVLPYFGGQKNSPKWISWGVVCSAISCLLVAWPHFIYGAGEEALQYTEEYLSANRNISSEIISMPVSVKNNKLCQNSTNAGDDCDEEFSYVPLILIFLSQFVLGIGNTLQHSLGPAYIDNNTKRAKNSPLMLSYVYAMSIFGPTLGYLFAYVILRIYIDPTLTPLISKDDPRWTGAWWLGWLVFALLLLVFAALIGLFPRSVKKEQTLEQKEADNEKCDQTEIKNNGELKDDFAKAVWRLLTNKLLMLKCFGSVFHILSFFGTMTFMGRMMEVGMAFGILLSGFVISKYNPRTSYVLFWGIIVGFVSLSSSIVKSQLGCGSNDSLLVNGSIISCNSNCICNDISYSPVCDRSTDMTYYSPCHAVCKAYDEKLDLFSDCACDVKLPISQFEDGHNITSGACVGDCSSDFYIYTFLSMASSFLGITGLMASVLLKFRAVEPRDKALAQGFSLFTSSLFGSLPAPLIFGKIIDNTCLIWNHKCGRSGNCLLYDPIKFRQYLHLDSAFFLAIAIVFDVLIWYYGRDLDLYGDDKQKPIKNEKDNSPENQPLNAQR